MARYFRSSPERGGGPLAKRGVEGARLIDAAPRRQPPPPCCARSPSPFRGGFWIAFLLLPLPALAAPPVVLSAAPDAVAVTLYRDPDRGVGGEIDRDAPNSFALIAETRTVTLPPGEVVVRFEGVASGIVPQSAILFGTDPRERNRDAALLSQKGLVDAFTGQRVILRRTDPATGKTVEEPATIRSAADRLVATTPRGTEALYCTGLNQTLLYPGAPATLSAKPVLSMTTKDQPGGRSTITLAYLATGFDWDATYVGTLAPDGKSLALLGWLTMASADDTSFPEATTSAVAGKINRSEDTRDDGGREAKEEAESLDTSYGCWPAGRTSDAYYPASPLPAPMMMEMDGLGDIVVTARRREEKLQAAPMAVSVVAKAENLGDLKLYRIPVPVTVAARSQKQVAFMVKDRVSGQLLYRSKIGGGDPEEPAMLFRFHNRTRDGMGDPLPGGKVILYQQGGYGRTLIAETSTPDKTVDEEVELTLGDAIDVNIEHAESGSTRKDGRGFEQHTMTIRNANPFPVRYEVDFPTGEDLRYSKVGGRLIDKPGKRVWSTTIPANDSQRLTYVTTPVEHEEE